MPAPLTTARGFDLAPDERRRAEAEIAELAKGQALPIAMAPGDHTKDLFPCGPLRFREVNVDCHGHLTKCCHLSGHGDGVGSGDVVDDLSVIGFAEAVGKLAEENETFRRRKIESARSAAWRDTDFFPCWYCSLYYEKVGWLERLDGHPWAPLVADFRSRKERGEAG